MSPGWLMPNGLARFREGEPGVVEYGSCTACAHRPILLRLSPPCEGGRRGGGTGTAGYLACRLRRCSRVWHRRELPGPASHPPYPPFARGGKEGAVHWSRSC